ncbi:ketoacyl reductase [Pullulanibacillus camelliae]|uniref:Ketoacyl reductase n=1 Tax=Pullulanibacillus camelliae TaxID=1707096 RepID=A0A8J2VK71_9BACL|nr:SDR family oxidoreductase [Pullulanibacillus camelliae]GGE33769.1 ketoacyl reductase [Pullulanibacillus camelliae]
MELGLANKTAIVTGGSKGIGKAIAKALAKEGCNVVICGRGKEELDNVQSEIQTEGGEIFAVQADITKQQDVESLISETISHYNTIDILVNNAGIVGGFYNFEALSVDDWQEVFDVNVFGMVRVTKAALPYMRKAASTRIINISSESGIQPDAFMPHYNATKAAMINFTKSLSKAYAKDGILVNSVSPAFIMTPLLEDNLQRDAEAQSIAFDEAVQAFLKENRPHIEVKRPGLPEEVAAAVVFLASDQASFITGENIRVDGGSIASQGA